MKNLNLAAPPMLAWWHERVFDPIHRHGGGFAAGVLVVAAVIVMLVLLARPTAP